MGTMASLGDGVGGLPRHSEGPGEMVEDGPGILGMAGGETPLLISGLIAALPDTQVGADDMASQSQDPESGLGSEGGDSVIVLTTQLPSTLVLLSQMASAKAVGVTSIVALSDVASHDAVAWLS